VVLHARLAEERGAFGFDDVARGLREKMVRRNPHVFRPDGSLQDSFPATVQEIEQNWDAVKKSERPERGSAFDGVPEALPALARARKLLDRAERAGLPTPAGSAVEGADGAEGAAGSEERLGEVLFGIVAAARRQGLDPERALRSANRRFERNASGGSGSAPRPGAG
jgi:XTP/dITP diphosphohydrolase